MFEVNVTATPVFFFFLSQIAGAWGYGPPSLHMHILGSANQNRRLGFVNDFIANHWKTAIPPTQNRNRYQDLAYASRVDLL